MWRSMDGGATWTDSTNAATAMTNIAPDGSIDGSVFFDKELLAVDNSQSSPNYGRLYVTFIKFHMAGPSGRSDYRPVQLAYTILAALIRMTGRGCTRRWCLMTRGPGSRTFGEPMGDAGRGRRGRPERRVRHRGVQHDLQPRHVLRTLRRRRGGFLGGGAD